MDNENHCYLNSAVMNQDQPPKTSHAGAFAPRVPAPESLPRISSTQILLGSKAAEIEHEGQRYILRLTRENKLILTK